VSNVTTESGEFIQSLERGLAVLSAFSTAHPRLTLSEAATLTGLSRATARRILHTFVALGYVRNDGRYFEPTPKVLDLGYAYLSSLQLGDIAQPTMEALSEQVNESVSLAVLDGCEIVYVARVPTKRIMSISLALGSRLPAFCTSMGRVLLAGLPPSELGDRLAVAGPLVARTALTVVSADALADVIAAVATDGFALVDEELETGVRSLAVPIRDRSGRVVAALNIGAQVGRVSLAEMHHDFLPLLLAAAAEISGRLAKR
jgi:IclR family transcriptional regulator, pca regulon regulatory protein